MEKALNNLIDRLSLEALEVNLYRGYNFDVGSGRIYGGQVLAQSLLAASKTVDFDERPIHSMHGYFLRYGDLTKPVVYDVDRIRDGGSFTTRNTTAIQNGHAIFNMSASFHKNEQGVEHQLEMPAVPLPEALAEKQQARERCVDNLPEQQKSLYTRPKPFEIRVIDFMDPVNPQKSDPEASFWFKTSAPLKGEQDSMLMHHALLAFASDWGLGGVAMKPHGLGFYQPHVQSASLDHSLWFHHHDFRVDEWLLYVMDSTASAGSRGFNRGSIYTHDGKLVASAVQESLIRVTTST